MPAKKCEHGVRKDHCRKCDPDKFCQHNRSLYTCKHCGGNGICIHRRHRSQCSRCNPEGAYKVYVYNETRNGRQVSDNFMTLGMFCKLIKQCCWFCKRTPDEADGMGIDRIDNDLGHVLGNIESCCFTCNHMRSDSTREEFLRQCERIMNGRKGV